MTRAEPNKRIKSLLTILLLLLAGGVVFDCLILGYGPGFVHRKLFSDDQLYRNQLSGGRCSFLHDYNKDGACDFEPDHRWIRHAEYSCRMSAAKCLAEGPLPIAVSLLPEIRKHQESMPPEYDTGDGVIKYRQCFIGVLGLIEKRIDPQGEFQAHHYLFWC